MCARVCVPRFSALHSMVLKILLPERAIQTHSQNYESLNQQGCMRCGMGGASRLVFPTTHGMPLVRREVQLSKGPFGPQNSTIRAEPGEFVGEREWVSVGS